MHLASRFSLRRAETGAILGPWDETDVATEKSICDHRADDRADSTGDQQLHQRVIRWRWFGSHTRADRAIPVDHDQVRHLVAGIAFVDHTHTVPQGGSTRVFAGRGDFCFQYCYFYVTTKAESPLRS